MTNTVRLEQAVALLSKYEKSDVNPPGRLTEILGLIQSALDVEKANEDRVLDYSVKLSIAREHLKNAVWMFNTVPNFSDGTRKSHDLSRDINSFLRG